MKADAKIFVSGHRGMVGSALVRRLRAGGYNNLSTRTHAETDLLDQRAVHALLASEKPDYLFIAAAKVGDIKLAETVMKVVGFNGHIVLDSSKPDGTPQKLLDVSRLAALGWRYRTPLQDGIRKAYADYLASR